MRTLNETQRVEVPASIWSEWYLEDPNSHWTLKGEEFVEENEEKIQEQVFINM
jgi:hypothetical protein